MVRESATPISPPKMFFFWMKSCLCQHMDTNIEWIHLQYNNILLRPESQLETKNSALAMMKL